MQKKTPSPSRHKPLPPRVAPPASPLRRGAGLLRPPAVRALLLQFAALLIVFIVGVAVEARLGLDVPVIAMALSQGAVAALLAWRIGLAPWWWLIQLAFPVALLAGSALAIPPAFFLLLFLILLALYWTTFRTQVPFFPSGRDTHEAVAALLPSGTPLRVIDIGSGLGGLVLALADRRPESRIAGVELAPLPWLVSRLRARLAGSSAIFLRADYSALDLGQYDVVFAYLSPAAMPALWCQARAQMRPGTLLLSYEFPIPDAPPDIVTPPDARGASLHGWRM